MAESPNQPAAPVAKKSSGRPDIATLAGLLLSVAGILGGLLLEGGKIADVSQVTAAMIVLGGTFGATLINTPMSVFLGAFSRLKGVFFEKADSPDVVIEEIIRFATKARKNGLVSLEAETDEIADPFLKKAITLAVDGTDLREIRTMLELDLFMREHRAENEAKVFESAGGYSPTIGIIGAVMGLIQVMKHLENIEEVGKGIAVAFVATVYGVAISNIFFLPAANKLKARNQQDAQMHELIIEGVSGIVEGLNPKLIRSKLEAYVPPAAPKKKSKEAPAPETASQPAEV